MSISITYNIDDENTIKLKSFDTIIDYDKVVYLDCGYNKLTSLPKLPNLLQELYCECNQLSELPELPNSLHTLWCSSNQLTSLPELPNSLHTLWCYYNKLILKQKYKYKCLLKIIYL
jgi:Leucine-rich repeat (LRR) protein